MDALHTAGLPGISFPVSAAVTTKDGQIASWDLSSINTCLETGLLPVVFGDVAFDSYRGGTILSTEDIFDYLALHLKPTRVLYAGIERGVWADYPQCKKIITEITPSNLPQYMKALGGSAAVDVTGGMASKVQQGMALVQKFPGLEVLIFSGNIPETIQNTLSGINMGTILHAGKH
jgi:isopentenyl phosphate kinase